MRWHVRRYEAENEHPPDAMRQTEPEPDRGFPSCALVILVIVRGAAADVGEGRRCAAGRAGALADGRDRPSCELVDRSAMRSEIGRRRAGAEQGAVDMTRRFGAIEPPGQDPYITPEQNRRIVMAATGHQSARAVASRHQLHPYESRAPVNHPCGGGGRAGRRSST